MSWEAVKLLADPISALAFGPYFSPYSGECLTSARTPALYPDTVMTKPAAT